MEKIIKQFQCTTKTEYSTTISKFTAIMRISYSSRFKLNVKSQKFENGILKSDNTANVYYETYKELKEAMKYHFFLCKENLLTTEITEII